jgi:hypothetical protein
VRKQNQKKKELEEKLNAFEENRSAKIIQRRYKDKKKNLAD